jgi:hypothetical protein
MRGMGLEPSVNTNYDSNAYYEKRLFGTQLYYPLLSTITPYLSHRPGRHPPRYAGLGFQG